MHIETAQVIIINAWIIMSVSCIDINECNTNNGGCEQFCHNTVGSYYCTCNNTYTLNADKHMCDGKLIWCV